MTHLSPVHYWLILRHAKVFRHRKVARYNTWLNGWLKRVTKVVANLLHFKWKRKATEEVLEGKNKWVLLYKILTLMPNYYSFCLISYRLQSLFFPIVDTVFGGILLYQIGISSNPFLWQIHFSGKSSFLVNPFSGKSIFLANPFLRQIHFSGKSIFLVNPFFWQIHFCDKSIFLTNPFFW